MQTDGIAKYLYSIEYHEDNVSSQDIVTKALLKFIIFVRKEQNEILSFELILHNLFYSFIEYFYKVKQHKSNLV